MTYVPQGDVCKNYGIISLMDDEAKMMWCAGFFQGEGYVGCRKNGGSLDIGITQYYDRTPLDKFVEYTGTGNVLGPYTNKYTDQVFQYRKTGLEAEAVILKLIPYLSGKKLEQANKALEQVWKRREEHGGYNKKNRPKAAKTHCIHGHDLSQVGRLNNQGYMVCKTCHARDKRQLRLNKKEVSQ